jgi:hypothetical protein
MILPSHNYYRISERNHFLTRMVLRLVSLAGALPSADETKCQFYPETKYPLTSGRPCGTSDRDVAGVGFYC